MKYLSSLATTILITLSFSSVLLAQSGLKNMRSSLEANEFFLIIEAGTLGSHVYDSNGMNNMSIFSKDEAFLIPAPKDERAGFISTNDGWENMGGFSASIKMGKSINTDFDSKVSFDFISGLGYKETNIFQKNYTADSHWPGGFGFFGCFYYMYVRDLNIKSIEIPLELRSNIHLNKFTISPILGFGIDIPFSKKETVYHPNYVEQDITRGEIISSEKLELNQNFSFNTISKIEISYQLANNHKLKFAGFYNLNITNEISNQLFLQQGLSTKGLQVGYEIPFASFVRPTI